MVGDRDGRHVPLRRRVDELFDAARAVQQAVFAVYVKMDKHIAHDPYFSISSRFLARSEPRTSRFVPAFSSQRRRGRCLSDKASSSVPYSYFISAAS
jgi:hypothetical protein